MRFLQQAIGPVIFAIVGTAAAYAIANSVRFDPNAACVSYSRELGSDLTLYIQDYDEKFPDMGSSSAFQTDMAQYVSDPKYFNCPATGQAYVPNATLSFQSVATVASTSSTEAFADAIPHRDGLKTVTYVSGTVKRGNVVQGDRTALCMENEEHLVQSTLQYVQDYDETFPPMNSPAQFKAAVYPYDQNSGDFVCPVTHKAYVPNAALSYLSQAVIDDPATTWIVADAIPHPDGISSVGFDDGHVTHGSYISDFLTNTGNVKAVLLAVLYYSQDYNETLPPMDSYTNFVNALLPYTKNIHVFYFPGTNTPYILNRSIGNRSITSFPDPGKVLVLRSPYLDRGGSLDAGYLDGHVVATPYSVVTTMAVGSDNLTRLLYSKATPPAVNEPIPGSVSLATIATDGQITERNYPHSGKGVALSLAPDTSPTFLLHQGPLPLNSLFQFGPIIGPMGDISPQFDPASIWSLSATDGVRARNDFGPFDGWKPVALAATPGSGSCALWAYYNGAAAIWFVSRSGKYTYSVLTTPPESGGFPADLAVATDGDIYLLWDNPGGTASIAILSTNGVLLTESSFGPVDGETAVSMAIAPDTHPRILWSGLDGSASIWEVTQTGEILGTRSLDSPDWVASKIAYGPDANLRLLWKNIQQSARLDIIKPNGSVVSTTIFKPYR